MTHLQIRLTQSDEYYEDNYMVLAIKFHLTSTPDKIFWNNTKFYG